MMILRSLILNMSLLAMCVPLCAQADWQIVVHKDSALQSLDEAEVKYLFTEGRVQGLAPELVDLVEEPMRAQFYESVLDMTLNRWRANWAKRVFTGNHRLPKQLPIDDVVLYMESNPHSVAYLPDTTLLPATLKVVYCESKERPLAMPLPCAPTAVGKLKKSGQKLVP